MLIPLAISKTVAFAQEQSSEAENEAKNEAKSKDAQLVSDETFRAALPDLRLDDPELARELEPIDTFEARFEALIDGPAKDGSQVQPADGAAQPDAPPSAPLSPQFKDPELAQPLPPLGTFDVLPLDFTPQLVVAKDPTPTLRYRWQVSGLEIADALTSADLQTQFETLSALEKGDGKAANIAMLTARIQDDKALLLRILKANGWYQAEVVSQIERAQPDEKIPAIALIEVEPGPRFTVSRIVIEADPTEPENLISDALTVQPGDPIIAADILFNEAFIAARLPANGYPFAAIGARDIALNADNADGVYTLPIEIGPRARIGGFAVGDAAVFDARHIAQIARFERGDLFDSRDLDDLRRALAATTLLRSFSVEPQATGDDVGDGTQYVTIKVDQTAGPARTIAGTAGYGTGQGLRVEGSWSHRNLFPPEGALTASVIAGTLEQGAALAFRRANAGKRDRTFDLGISALRSNFEAFEATTGRVGATYAYVSTPIWQKRITYAFGAEILASVEDAFDTEIGDFAEQTYLIGAVSAQAGFDTSDDLLNPTRGFRLEALVQPEGSIEGGFTPYVRTVIDASAYVPASDSIVLAGRARFGTIQGADGVDIAPSRRLYAGGGGSVRGFGFQELGPRVQVPNPDFDPSDPDTNEDPFTLESIGGRSVVEASAEARYRFGDYGVVAFVDAGQVYTDTIPRLSDIRFGVGVGARIYTNFGPIRVDVGTPVNRRSGESRINLYVSIGQAF
ncbi:MAG: BamA/TamA family outer membrane protein [Pseudomonadota bacterium]